MWSPIMDCRKLVNEDTTGTVRKMIWIFALWAAAGMTVGIFVALNTSCAGAKPILNDVSPKVVELTADECVKIATQNGNKDLASLCATVEDILPFLPLIMAEQKKRLARQADGGAQDASSAEPTASSAPSPSPVSAPACSCPPPAPLPALSCTTVAPAPSASAPALHGRK